MARTQTKGLGQGTKPRRFVAGARLHRVGTVTVRRSRASAAANTRASWARYGGGAARHFAGSRPPKGGRSRFGGTSGHVDADRKKVRTRRPGPGAACDCGKTRPLLGAGSSGRWPETRLAERGVACLAGFASSWIRDYTRRLPPCDAVERSGAEKPQLVNTPPHTGERSWRLRPDRLARRASHDGVSRASTPGGRFKVTDLLGIFARVAPYSIRHDGSQPSPGVELPSSHCSPAAVAEPSVVLSGFT